MWSLIDLERRFGLSPPPPRDQGRIAAICLRKGGGVHRSVPEAELSVVEGVIGDRWSNGETPMRHSQITLINASVSGLLAHAERAAIDSGDNFHVDLDLSEENLPVGARLALGEAILEVTDKPHRGCAKFSARFGQDALRWVNLEPSLALRLRGVHCEVIEGGAVRVGDEVRVLQRR